MTDTATSFLECTEFETAPAPDASVIVLHGLGADGFDLRPLAETLALPAGTAVRFVFPHAPYLPVSINQGYVMRAWYDIRHPDLRLQEDEAGVRGSVAAVSRLIRREQERGVASARIVLAGFSQGGVIALHAGLRYPERLAGLVALSAYLPFPHSLDAEAPPANRRTPVFLAHGTNDPIVPYALGEEARRTLEAREQPVVWHRYAMGHGISGEEIADLRPFLARVLSDAGG